MGSPHYIYNFSAYFANSICQKNKKMIYVIYPICIFQKKSISLPVIFALTNSLFEKG